MNIVGFKTNEKMIWESSNDKLLGVNLNVTFKDHMSSICVLRRLLTILNLDQRRILMESFIDSQFNYCPCFITEP